MRFVPYIATILAGLALSSTAHAGNARWFLDGSASGGSQPPQRFTLEYSRLNLSLSFDPAHPFVARAPVAPTVPEVTPASLPAPHSVLEVQYDLRPSYVYPSIQLIEDGGVYFPGEAYAFGITFHYGRRGARPMTFQVGAIAQPIPALNWPTW